MLSAQVILGRLLFACVCGAFIGLERERHGRAAGLRTHMLVALGSAAIMVVSLMILELPQVGGDINQIVRVDPGRIAAQVVTGIGFLGAGAIIHARRMISGLTTAACLWVAAAIGLAAGCGMFFLAGVVMLISLFSLYLLKWIEHVMVKDRYHDFLLICRYQSDMLARIESLFSTGGVRIIAYSFTHDKEAGRLKVRLEVRTRSPRLPQELLDQLAAEADILKLSWR